MKVVYVTGCLGFIGYHVTKKCLDKGWYVIGVDKETYAANLQFLPELQAYPKFKYIKQDISLVSERNTSIPKDIRDLCFKKFSAIPNFNVPDLCGQLEHTSVYVEALKVPLLETSKPS